MIDDEKIIEMFFERSEQGIRELDIKYGKACHNLSYHIVGSRQDAEECVNDAYLGAWNAIPPARPNPLLSYLLKIVRNISLKIYWRKVDVWSGEHTMYEFLLGTGMGDTQYWGVYYSPDDVPLPYQNTDVSLIADDDGSWTWQTDGDNHGTTKKIIEKWYYFEASF